MLRPAVESTFEQWKELSSTGLNTPKDLPNEELLRFVGWIKAFKYSFIRVHNVNIFHAVWQLLVEEIRNATMIKGVIVEKMPMLANWISNINQKINRIDVCSELELYRQKEALNKETP